MSDEWKKWDEVLEHLRNIESMIRFLWWATGSTQDVACVHGSRWVWWEEEKQWRQVVFAPGCDCDPPPLPIGNEEARE